MTTVEFSPPPAPPRPPSALRLFGQRVIAPGTGGTDPVRSSLSWVLMVLAGLAIWTLLFAYVFSGLQEQRSQATAYANLRSDLTGENPKPGRTIPVNAPIATGAYIGLVNVPKIGIKNLVLFEGTSSTVTEKGPGHLPNTVLPGQVGVSFLYGRSVTFGAPFGSIGKLKAQDLISVTTGQGTFNFHVLDVRFPGSPVPAYKSGTARLVLETAGGSSIAPSDPLYVDADLTGQPATGTTVDPASASDAAMQGDTSGLPTMLLWLEGLLLVAIGAVWTARRWGRWQTWLVAGPALLGLLFGATASAALLLPNLL